MPMGGSRPAKSVIRAFGVHPRRRKARMFLLASSRRLQIAAAVRERAHLGGCRLHFVPCVGTFLRMPITSFANTETLAIFEGRRLRGISGDVAARAQVKLDMLDHAESLRSSPPPART